MSKGFLREIEVTRSGPTTELKVWFDSSRSAARLENNWLLRERGWEKPDDETFFRLLVPSKATETPFKVSQVCVMFSSLDEVLASQSTSRYRQEQAYREIADGLIAQDISVLLFATPFHLWRAASHVQPRSGGQLFRLSKFLMSSPELVYEYFDVVAEEMTEILGAISQRSRDDSSGDTGVLSHILEPRADISVLGFSFGGLLALHTFLRPDLGVQNCVLLSSGGGLAHTAASGQGASGSWRQNANGLLAMGREGRRHFSADANTPEPEFNLIDLVLFGGPVEFALLMDGQPEIADSILVVSGADDTVTSVEAVMNRLQPKRSAAALPPPGMSEMLDEESADMPPGINVIQIAGLSHILAATPQWKRWLPIVSELVASFLKRRDDSVLTDDELQLVLAYVSQFEDPQAPILPADVGDGTWRSRLRSLVQSRPRPEPWEKTLHTAYHIARVRWTDNFERWRHLQPKSGEDSFEDYLRWRISRDHQSPELIASRAKRLRFPDHDATLMEYCSLSGISSESQAERPSQQAPEPVRLIRGRATEEQIRELVSEISKLYEMFGGSGIRVTTVEPGAVEAALR